MRYSIPSLVILVLLVGAGVSAGQITFKANNGFAESSGRREDITIVVTQGPNGYTVSGEFKWQTENKSCTIKGTYYPSTGRLRASCGKNVDINATAILVDGKHALNLTEPFSAIARQEKPSTTVLPPPALEKPSGMDLSGAWAGNLTDSSDCVSRWDLTLKRDGTGDWQGSMTITQINCAVTQTGKKVSDPMPVKIVSLGSGKLKFVYMGYNYEATYNAGKIVWDKISFAKK